VTGRSRTADQTLACCPQADRGWWCGSGWNGCAERGQR